MLHIKWHGLLTPQFVQRVVETAMYVASAVYDLEHTNPWGTLLPRHVVTSSGISLIGLTIHGSTEVPVLTPPRVPRLEGEDTASIIFTSGDVGDAAKIRMSTSSENLVGE
jgi:hypothetical protein